MANIEIPRVEELDFSRVHTDTRLVRHAVGSLLQGFRWSRQKDREDIIREALADRPAFVNMLLKEFGNDRTVRAFQEGQTGVDDLQGAAKNAADIVLDAFEKQLS